MSDLSLDIRFISTISSSLPLFSWQRYGEVASFRCILCGDSKKDKTKTRGFFYPDKHRLGMEYKCHNCGESMKFWYFLKTQFPEYYKEYRLEKFKNAPDKTKTTPAPPMPKKEPPVKKEVVKFKSNPEWIYISELPDSHKAKVYCVERGLTNAQMSKIVYADSFSVWVDKYIGVCDSEVPDNARLVFPFIDENGECYGAQGRVFYPSSDKDRFRIAMQFDSKKGKLFGLERLNLKLPVLVVEGVIDSLFLPNCIAICGGDINESFKTISKDIYVILDNEPRSVDTVNRMRKAIEMGFRVVFWNIDTKYKDINDMVFKGKMTTREIIRHIYENSYAGAQAKAKMTFWKRT